MIGVFENGIAVCFKKAIIGRTVDQVKTCGVNAGSTEGKSHVNTKLLKLFTDGRIPYWLVCGIISGQ